MNILSQLAVIALDVAEPPVGLSPLGAVIAIPLALAALAVVVVIIIKKRGR